MTVKTDRQIGRRAAKAVQSALAPLLKTLEVDGGAALEISIAAEAEIQRLAQAAVDRHWPGRFEVACSLQDSGLNLTMKPRKVVH